MIRLVTICLFCWALFFTYNAQAHDTGKVVSDETKRLIHQMSIKVNLATLRGPPGCALAPNDHQNGTKVVPKR